jgi:prophage tail gpP-like protein
MAFPASEIAVLAVNGMLFRDWESVSVRWTLNEFPHYQFRFTCSEDVPLAGSAKGLQIAPGMSCQVSLGGNLAISGYVTTRQVFYDANRHYVEIQGGTQTLNMATNSTVVPGQEFKDKSVAQITQQIVQQSGNSLKVTGGSLPQNILRRFGIPWGESNLDSLSRLHRSFGSLFTSDPQGSFVVSMGPTGGGAAVIEGVNILEGREIWYNQSYATSAPIATQQTGHKATGWGAAVSSVPFVEQMFNLQGINWKAQQAVISELPGVKGVIPQGRGENESILQEADYITVFATVYGWSPGQDKGQGGGGLWPPPRSNVYVKSPMLIMDRTLQVKTVTFLQDNQVGTRTILELCNNRAMSGGAPQAGP